MGSADGSVATVADVEQLSVIRTSCCDIPCVYAYYVGDAIVRIELPRGWGVLRGRILSRGATKTAPPQNQKRFKVECCRGPFELTLPGHVKRENGVQ